MTALQRTINWWNTANWHFQLTSIGTNREWLIIIDCTMARVAQLRCHRCSIAGNVHFNKSIGAIASLRRLLCLLAIGRMLHFQTAISHIWFELLWWSDMTLWLNFGHWATLYWQWPQWPGLKWRRPLASGKSISTVYPEMLSKVYNKSDNPFLEVHFQLFSIIRWSFKL